MNGFGQASWFGWRDRSGGGQRSVTAEEDCIAFFPCLTSRKACCVGITTSIANCYGNHTVAVPTFVWRLAVLTNPDSRGTLEAAQQDKVASFIFLACRETCGIGITASIANVDGDDIVIVGILTAKQQREHEDQRNLHDH